MFGAFSCRGSWVDGKTGQGGLTISETSYPQSASVAEVARAVAALLARGERPAAVRHAMAASDDLLRTPSNALRIALRMDVFKLFATSQISYQANDFGSIDYDLFELASDLPMFRGPPPSMSARRLGEYFCVIGAAQTFGRLVARPWPFLLSEAP